MPKKKQTEARNAVIYARFSSHSQNEASIDQQVEKCREYAAKHGISITDVYADKAMTGTNDKRPNFRKMMKDAAKGKFDTVIAWKSNRIGRNMLDAMINDAKLSECGVRCLYVEEDFGDSAAGRFALRNMMNVNQFYSENMAEDIVRGLYDNAQKCKVNGPMTFGYRKGADGRYEIDETTGPIAQEIFKRIASGEMLADIAADLNARGIKTSFGRKWGKNSFHCITNNEKYIGIYTYGDVRIEGGVPRLISDETFFRVREMINRRSEVVGRRNESAEYILTGKLYCGECGTPMTGVSGTSKTGDMHFYYVCRKHRAHECRKKNIRKEAAELLVVRALREYVLREDVIEWMADVIMHYQDKIRQESQLAYYEEQLAQVKKSLDNIMKAIEAGIFSSTTKNRLQELEAEERELKAKIAMEKAAFQPVTREQVIYYMETFRDGKITDLKYQKRIINAFLEKAYLFDDRIKIAFNYSKELNDIEIPITLDSVDESSYNYSYAPPLAAETNSFSIVTDGKMFVLTVFIDIM